MARDRKKSQGKGTGGAVLARQITLVILTVFICVTIVLFVISLDLMMNPS